MADQLVLDLSKLPPGDMEAPHIVGGSVEGGTSLSGLDLASDVSGGGLVAVEYSQVQLQAASRDSTLYFNRLMVALQGGIRTCDVPLMTDIYAPVADDFFPNETGATPIVTGAILLDHDVGEATVQLDVVDGRPLQGGEWFGLVHPTKGPHAYCIVDVETQTTGPTVSSARVSIRPPLREAIATNDPVTWWRPLCRMRLRVGGDLTMRLTENWRGVTSMNFIESMSG